MRAMRYLWEANRLQKVHGLVQKRFIVYISDGTCTLLRARYLDELHFCAGERSESLGGTAVGARLIDASPIADDLGSSLPVAVVIRGRVEPTTRESPEPNVEVAGYEDNIRSIRQSGIHQSVHLELSLRPVLSKVDDVK